MNRLPDVVFVIDSNKEQIAVREARKLGIPVVAVVDTNCDPTEVDYVNPGNDDALRAIRLFTAKISESIAEGVQAATDKQSGELAAAAQQAGAAAAETPVSYEESQEYPGEPSDAALAATAPDGEDSISMEAVMGTKSTRKGPASESKAESVE